MVDDIIFAMENQDEWFVFDAQEGFCIPDDYTSEDEDDDEEDEDRYYNIPEWTSADGFHVMEQFTAQVHNPLLREALRDALNQRKGVFRRFKTVLQAAPQIEQEWYRFKDRQMKAAVYEWYNDLRAVWGLKKLSFEEETEPQLLLQDFSFAKQPAKTLDKAVLEDFIKNTAQYSDSPDSMLPDTEVAAIAASMLLGKAWRLYPGADGNAADARDRDAGGSNTGDGEAVGKNGAIIISASTDDELGALCVIIAVSGTGSLCIPFLRVLPEYRGLGLGKALLQRAIAYTEAQEARALLFSDFCAPPHFITQLEQNGFVQKGLFYIKE